MFFNPHMNKLAFAFEENSVNRYQSKYYPRFNLKTTLLNQECLIACMTFPVFPLQFMIG